MSQVGVYLEAYFSFFIFSVPSCLSCPWSNFDGCTTDFTFFWIFVITCFLKVLWFSVCWQQNTKVSVLLVYKWILLWCIFYCHILKLFFGVFNGISIVWHIQFIECSDEILVSVFVVIFLLNIIFYKRKYIDSLLCVLSPPRILLGIDIYSALMFKSWMNYWQDWFLCYPNYRTSIHLVGYYFLPWYFIFLILTHHRFV